MNREIEFRGKLSHSGEWVFGGLLKIDNKYHIVTESDMYEDGHHICQESDTPTWVDPDTVGQFTGMTDKKDAKIYDGDILFVEFADKSGGYQLVGWNEKTASWGIMDAYSYQSIKEGCDFAEFKNYVLLAFLEKAIVFEVVGNIYNNPELLSIK